MRKQWRIKWVWSFLGLEEQAVTVHCLARSFACFPSSSLPEVRLCWPQITQQIAWYHVIHFEDAKQGLLFQAVRLFRGRGALQHTYTDFPCPSLLVIPTDSVPTDFDTAMAKAGKQILRMESQSQLGGWTAPAPASLNRAWSVLPRVTASSHPEILNSQQGQPNPR